MQSLLTTTRAYRLLGADEQRGELSHAYLLLFDDGPNLRVALKTFAKRLFACEKEETQAQQRVSRLIDDENFSDCLFFPEPSKKFMVEDAETISEESLLKPVEGEKKLFVVDGFDFATPAAQNKLLKLLEEPPEGVLFLLGARTEYPVLPTVLSRVKTLEIPPFSTEEIKGALLRNYGGRYEMNDYELCAAACGGSLGAAQDMLDSGSYKQLVENAFALCLAKSHELPQAVKKVGDTKRKRELLSLLRILFRDALLYKTGTLAKNAMLQSEKSRLQAIANGYSLSALVYAQEAISEAEKDVAFNAYFPQCVELLIAKIQRKGK